MADGRSLEFDRIDATPHAVLGNRVVELVMEVRVPDRMVRFRNAAVEVEGCWFLATLEPVVDG